MGNIVLIAIMVIAFVGVMVFKKSANQALAKGGVAGSTVVLIGCLIYMIFTLDGGSKQQMTAHQNAMAQTNYAVGEKVGQLMQQEGISGATIFVLNYTDKQDDYKFAEIKNGIASVIPSSDVKYDTIRPVKLSPQGTVVTIIEDNLTPDEISNAIANAPADDLIISTVAFPENIWRGIGKRKVLFLNQQFIQSNSNVFRQPWCVGAFAPKKDAPASNRLLDEKDRVFELRYNNINKSNVKEMITY